jgi:asparagine synthase (glutamine-hydrolysing)
MKIKSGKAEKKVYWDLTALHARFDFADKTKVEKKIHELLLRSVERRLVSDVPVGAFLSGGIDSSAVVGLMAEASPARPNTFNVSFDEKEYDESGYASLVAKKFNANHERILLKPVSFLEELQNALDAMDTPSGDGINTYVVSKAIRKKGMTVALSGIGGDELFAGYPVFQHYLQLQNKKWLWKLPMGLRKIATSVMTGSTKDRVSQLLRLPSCSIENVYPIFRQILSPLRMRELTTLTPASGGAFITALQKELLEKKENLLHLPLLSQLSAAEWLGYTQHTLLKDTDQMSMAVSLEVREPFFDLDLVEFVLSVPDTLKKPQYPKSLLVESLKPLLPDEIVFRKKQGFDFPWNLWLRNELQSFCEHHIKNISERPFIRGQQLMKYWKDFQKGNENIRWPEIWLFVVLDYWMEKNGIQ